MSLSEEWSSLLQALQSPDNEMRRKAEHMYASAASNPPMVARELVGQLKMSEHVGNRILAAVLLRRFLSRSTENWTSLTPEVKHAESFVARKIAHTVSEVAVSAVPNGEWDNLLDVVVSMSSSANPAHQPIGLYVIGKLAEYLSQVVGPHAEALANVLSVKLSDANIEVRVRALEAFVSVVLALDDKDDRARFESAVPALLEVLAAALREDEWSAKEALQSFERIAAKYPTFLRAHIESAASAMIAIAQHEDFESDVRTLAMEVLLTVAELAGGMARKTESIVQNVLPLAMSFLTLVDDEDDWENSKDDAAYFVGDEEDPIVHLGETALSRIMFALGGATTMPLMTSHVQPWLVDGDWRKRRAALITFALAMEPCKQQVLKDIRGAVALVQPSFQDSHPRVVHAAVHCLGQMAADFREVPKGFKPIQPATHDVVVPLLVAACSSDMPSMRVRAHAAAALTNFCHPEVCKVKHLGDVSVMMKVLMDLLQHGSVTAQENALTAIGAVAAITTEGFAPSYPAFMELALNIMQHANTEETVLLRCKAIESAAWICQSLGADKVKDQAIQVVEFLIQMQSNGFADDDALTFRYVNEAISRLSECLGDDFAPYSRLAIPFALETAAREVKVVMVDVQEGEQAPELEGLDAMRVAIDGVGERQLGLDTGAMQDKATATHMLYQYLENVPDQFAPFLDRAVEVLCPLTTYRASEKCRVAAICSLPKLLGVAALDTANPKRAYDVAMKVLETACELLSDQQHIWSPSDQAAMGESLSEITRLCKESLDDDEEGAVKVLIPLEVCKSVLEAVVVAMRISEQRRRKVLEVAAADEDFDEAQNDALMAAMEEEDDTLTVLVDSAGYLIKAHRAAIMPVLSASGYASLMGEYLAVEGIPALQAAAICMFDDLIEFASPEAHALFEQYFPTLMASLASPMQVLRQAAVYGVGVLAQHASELLKPQLATAVSSLVAASNDDMASEEEFLACTDNAMSSLVKILTVFEGQGLVDEGSIVQEVLGHMPLEDDSDEAPIVHQWFFERLATGYEGFIGAAPEYGGLTACLSLACQIVGAHQSFTEEYEAELVNEATMEQIPSILFETLPGLVGGQAFQAAINALDEESQGMLQMMSGGE